MAMELLIPALAVGGLGLYLSDKKNESNPHTKRKQKQNIQPLIENEIKKQYKPVNNYKTTNDNQYQMDNSLPGRFTSIRGDVVDVGDFKHNNMKPFFGSRVKQRSVKDTDYILDNMQGTGSEHFKKKEQESLFKPTKELGWTNGTPSSSDFIQSRMNAGLSRNNDKPWEEIRVGPGLNQGYGSKGSGGFNSSLESRGQWIDKSVDELRTANNPKISYDGVTLGGKNITTNRGIEGKVEQYKPDTYYSNTQDRYLTTTGSHVAHTAHSEQMMGNPKRPDTSIEYYGSKSNSNRNGANYVNGVYKPSIKQQLKAKPVGAAYNGNALRDGKKNSYNILPNSRSVTEENSFFGGLLGIAKEVIMPVRETIRPSRKENVIGNLNSVGNVGVRGNTYVSNKQPAKTTIKETTASTERLANVGGGVPGSGYLTNSQTPANTQRTTTTQSYFGPSGNTQKSTNNAAYGAFYNAHTNTNKEEVSRSRANMGNMQMFNNTCNTQTIRKEQKNNYVSVANGTNITPGIQTHGSLSAREQVRQEDRLGGYLVDSLGSNPYNRSILGN